jgi:glycerol-3-phosphate acyltransferase PlsY
MFAVMMLSSSSLSVLDLWVGLMVAVVLAIVGTNWSKRSKLAQVAAAVVFALASSLPVLAIIWWHCDPWWWCFPG